jgi:hypothetical protein
MIKSDEIENVNESYQYLDTSNSIDLSYDPWLIENINRGESAYILMNYRECFQTGTFLIRSSETNNLNYTCCILLVFHLI